MTEVASRVQAEVPYESAKGVSRLLGEDPCGFEELGVRLLGADLCSFEELGVRLLGVDLCSFVRVGGVHLDGAVGLCNFEVGAAHFLGVVGDIVKAGVCHHIDRKMDDNPVGEVVWNCYHCIHSAQSLLGLHNVE